MDCLEQVIVDEEIGTLKFLLYEDPILIEHVLSCGATVKEKLIETNIYDTLKKLLPNKLE